VHADVSDVDDRQVADVAAALSALVIWFAPFVAGQAIMVALDLPDRDMADWQFVLVVAILYAPLLVVSNSMYQVARGIGSRHPGLWSFAPIVPLFNLIGPVILHARAKQWLREHGLEVGPFGLARATVAELQQKAKTEQTEDKGAE